MAVLISKALVEIPPKFADWPPVNPDHDKHRKWKGAEGLADDVRYYGRWMREEAEKRIGHLYPKATLPDGSEATVIAWLWARTVASPDPMARGAHVPLTSSLLLSARKGSEVWLDIRRNPEAPDGWRFELKKGRLTKELEAEKKLGTKAGKAQDFLCVLTGTPIKRSYIQAEGKAGRLSQRLMAIVGQSPKGRVYLDATTTGQELSVGEEYAETVQEARSTFLDGSTPTRAMITGGVCSAYGLRTWGHLFTDRQLVTLTTLSGLVGEARARALRDARESGSVKDDRSLAEGGEGLVAYADAVATYLGMGISRLTDICNSPLSLGEFKDTSAKSIWTTSSSNGLGFCRAKCLRRGCRGFCCQFRQPN